MPVTTKQYQQSLVNTSKYYTCDYLAEYLETSGDSVERFLKNKKLKPNLIWETQKDDIIYSPNGGIIIDKTVLEHRNSKNIETAFYQYSGQSHSVKMGIGVINLVYYNPELDQFWLIDYRIWNGGLKGDGISEVAYAKELIQVASKRGVIYQNVYVDGYYASSEFLNYIALDLKKTFYTNLSSTNKASELYSSDEMNEVNNSKANNTNPNSNSKLK